MKKNYCLLVLLVSSSLFAEGNDYSVMDISFSKTDATFVRSSGKVVDSGLDLTKVGYSRYSKNYEIFLGYTFSDEQTQYTTTTTSGSIPYELKKEVSYYSLSYINNFYISNELYFGPMLTLSRSESTSYALISDGYIWTSTNSRKSSESKYTDNDLSLNVVGFYRYESNSYAYMTLTLVDDLFFKNEGMRRYVYI